MIWASVRERAEAYHHTFSGPTGEKVLDDLKEVLGHNRSTFDPNPYIAAFNEGKRAVLVAIMNTMRPIPEDEEIDG